MRNSPHLNERHLMEAVRRRVITEDQLHGILAVARSMAAAEGGAAPDLGWITAVHGLAAAAAVVCPALYLLAQVDKISGAGFALCAGALALVSLGGGVYLRKKGLGRVPAAILLAGAAVFAWGAGAGLYDALGAETFGRYLYWSGGNYELTRANREAAFLVGDAVGIAVALALALRWRIAVAAAGASLAAVHGVIAGVERWGLHGRMNDDSASVVLLGLGVVMLAGARLMEKRAKGPADPAFWVLTVGLAPLGVGALIRIDRSPGEVVVWLAVAALVAALGVLWSRRSYLAAAAMALMVYPAFACGEARLGEGTVVAALVLSAVAVVVGATLVRRHYVAAWLKRPAAVEERSVWM